MCGERETSGGPGRLDCASFYNLANHFMLSSFSSHSIFLSQTNWGICLLGCILHLISLALKELVLDSTFFFFHENCVCLKHSHRVVLNIESFEFQPSLPAILMWLWMHSCSLVNELIFIGYTFHALQFTYFIPFGHKKVRKQKQRGWQLFSEFLSIA